MPNASDQFLLVHISVSMKLMIGSITFALNLLTASQELLEVNSKFCAKLQKSLEESVSKGDEVFHFILYTLWILSGSVLALWYSGFTYKFNFCFFQEFCEVNVGSIFLESVDFFQAYEIYCSKQVRNSPASVFYHFDFISLYSHVFGIKLDLR